MLTFLCAQAKSGMNGQSDSTNGKNVIYDEMVDELCDADGSDRLEYCESLPLPQPCPPPF